MKIRFASLALGCLLFSCREFCGDGVVQAPEECDDGNNIATDACVVCFVQEVCGDGIAQPPESCDDGNDDDSDFCVAGCLSATCGDGFVQTGVEACDDGNDTLGDGCGTGCQIESTCGNGVIDLAEDCDDGNHINGDLCDDQCQREPVCGDGVAEPPEECDDGAANADTGACKPSCEKAACGDALVHSGGEECDDGNISNTDTCTNACRTAVCGDGFQHFIIEACDDGNVISGDGCDNTCHVEGCNNGVIDTNEVCLNIQQLVTSGDPSRLVVGDFNGDGVDDLASCAASHLESFFGASSGVTPGPAVALGGSLGACVGLTIANFDASQEDLAATFEGPLGGTIVLLTNNTSDFLRRDITLPGVAPRDVVSVDLTGDALDDLIVASHNQNKILTISNIGAGDTIAEFTTGGSPFGLALGRFVGEDEILDLAVMNSANTTANLYRRDAQGALFSSIVIGTSGVDCLFGQGIDIIGDSHDDLVSVNRSTREITITPQNAGGVFLLSSKFNTGLSAPTSFVAGDLNNDGDIDVAVVDQSTSGVVATFLNDRNGSFTTGPSFVVGDTPTHIRLGDFNSDGAPDLAVANSVSGAITLLLSDP